MQTITARRLQGCAVMGKFTKGMRITMSLKKLLPLLLAVLTIFALAGCDGRDGNTSGSAESNGMISDDSRDHISKDTAGDLGDHVSDLISDVESGAEDLISDVESGAEDLVSDATSAVSDLVDGK